MRYVKDNVIYDISEIRALHTNMSIPTGADLTDIGYSELILTPAPVQEGFKAVEVAPVNNTQTWKLVEIIPEPEIVPDTITQRQARLIMLERGILEIVENALKDIPAKYIEWNYASVIERGSPLIMEMASNLGLSEEDVDDLFISASKL